MQYRDDSSSDLLWIYSSQNVFQIAGTPLSSSSESPASLLTRARSTVAGVTLLLYDQALTFSEEVRLVWKAPWNFAKALFLFVSTRLRPIVHYGT